MSFILKVSAQSAKKVRIFVIVFGFQVLECIFMSQCSPLYSITFVRTYRKRKPTKLTNHGMNHSVYQLRDMIIINNGSRTAWCSIRSVKMCVIT